MSIEFEELTRFEYEYIFEYYDMPLFFILKSPNNELYLNYMIDEINIDEYKWFFSRISRIELDRILNNFIGIKSFLIQLINEERMEYLVINNKEQSLSFNKVIELKDDELPLEDYKVEYDYLRNEKIENQEENIRIDSSEFDLILRDVNNSHLIDVNILANILGKMEMLYTNISKGYSSLKVEAVYPSSFGLRLVGEEDLLNTSEKTLENILILFNNIKESNFSNIEENLNIDKLYDLKAINKAKQLVEDIYKYNISLEIKPKQNVEYSHFIDKEDKSKFKKLSDFIDQITPIKTNIEVSGVATSINMNYSKFSIIGEDNIRYSGKLDKKFKEDIADIQFVIPAKIKAELSKIEKYNFEKDDYDISYEMKNYHQTID
ncbi:hypothetical protein ACR0RE_00100 [Staphylococcus haemolyticus]